MLDINSSRIEFSEPRSLHSTFNNVEEGSVLINVLENGSSVVRTSTGTGTEFFAGVAMSQVMNTSRAPAYEEVSFPATGATISTVLTFTPIAGTLGVINLATGTPLTVITTGNPTASQVLIVGKTLTVHADNAGVKARAAFSRTLTVPEAHALYGQGILDGAQSVIDTTGVVTYAPILFTDRYDTKSNWWAAPGPVKLGADGVFTLDGTGSEAKGVTVVQAPSASNPFLGVRVNVL